MNSWKFGLAIAILSAFVGIAPGAFADGHGEETTEVEAPDSSVDITAITCRDLLLANAEDEVSITVFIQGYLSGKNGDIEIDSDALRAANDRSFEYCVDHPDDTLLTVFAESREAVEEVASE